MGAGSSRETAAEGETGAEIEGLRVRAAFGRVDFNNT
jgi:hypothetical protein